VPQSARAWTLLSSIRIENNDLSGGVLPALPFKNMIGPLPENDCTLFGNPTGGSNSFDCPWPAGATDYCTKGYGNHSARVTDSDCTAYRCDTTAGQCLEDSSGMAASACISACHACTGASTQLPADQCAGWIAFYDATGGPHWSHTQPGTNYGKPICSGSRTDPCSCTGFVETRYPVCNPEHTAIVGM
jgi:hypothetical protein